jgi:gamma-glutamyltranspeptidase/glutathione hydrolase
MKNGRYIKQNDKIINPHLKNFLEGIISQDKDMYIGKITKNLVMEMHTHGGLISKNDIDAYRVIEREPLCIKYRDREIFTNPPPSFGGIMIALSLEFLRNNDISPGNQETDTFFISLIELMRHVDRFRSMQIKDWIERIPYPFEKPEISQLIQTYQETVAERLSMTTQGTTHISIIDEEGNAASMTSSNGSGSGYFIPDTGIMLNNMMGEDDLHPEGFFCAPCGKRVSSMMAPTIVMKNGKVETVMGSGGSKRIRTAMLQVLINSIDFHYPLKEAIEAPRIHWEDNRVQVEPEIPEKVLERLKKQYTMNIWKEKSVYFGGVHAVTGDMEGWGDSRRGGNCLKYS